MSYTYYRRYQQPRPRRRKSSSFRPFFYLVLFLVFCALVLKACVSVIHNRNEERRDEAVVTVIAGSAEQLAWGSSDWTSVADAQLLLEGDQIRTGGTGLVTMTFQNGTEVHLDASTQVVFESVEIDGDNDRIVLDIVDGRAWIEQIPKERGQFELILQTDVLNVQSLSGEYLVSNQANAEYVYPIDGSVTVEYVDRSDDAVIETRTLDQGSKTVLTDEAERALLARQDLSLVEEAGSDFVGDEFVMWNLGTISIIEPEEEEEVLEEEPEEEPEEALEPEVEEEVVVEEVESLRIQITSPAAETTIDDDAIALEGSIISGEAARITVTWSGNGQPYELGLFEPGDSSFRYVADAEYANLSSGRNVYTVKAYDSSGAVSNVIEIVVNANF